MSWKNVGWGHRETTNIVVISCIFCNMIDIAGLASDIIYKEQNPWFNRRSTKKVPERSCQRAMYAFDWSLQYQPSCDEKAFPSRRSRNGDWTTNCVTTWSSSCLYHASWQSWIHSDRWKLLFLQKPKPETTEDKKNVRENAILQHFSLAIPPSEKVACFNKKVKLLVRNHFVFKRCFHTHQVKVQLYLCSLLWVKKISIPSPRNGWKIFSAILLTYSNLKMWRCHEV